MVIVVAGLWLGWAGVTRIRGKGFPRLPLGGAWSLAVIGGIVVIAGLTLPRQFMRPNVATPTPSSGARPASTATLAIDEPSAGRPVAGGRGTARCRHDARRRHASSIPPAPRSHPIPGTSICRSTARSSP